MAILFYGTMTVASMLFAKMAVNSRQSLKKNGTTLIFSILSLLPFILCTAFRNEIGTDWYIYKTFFETINNGGEKFSEVGFNLLNRLVYMLNGNFQVLIAVTAIIIYSFVFKAIYDQSVLVPFSILIYVISAAFFTSLNQLRQAIAMAIFLYSLKYIWQRKMLMYFLWIAIASTMHASALFYIPLYFIYGRKVNLRFQTIFLAVNVALIPVLSKLFRYFVSKTRYSWYFGSAYDANNFYLVGFAFSMIVLTICYFYYYYDKNKDNIQYNFMTNVYYLATLSLLYSAALPQIVRVYNCYTIIICMLIPHLVFKEKKRTRRIVLYILIFVIFIAKLLYDIYVLDWYLTAPQIPIY